MDAKVKEIIEKIRKGELEPLGYTTINDKGENVIIICFTDNHILVTTAQHNGWIRMNEYDDKGNMIGEIYER